MDAEINQHARERTEIEVGDVVVEVVGLHCTRNENISQIRANDDQSQSEPIMVRANDEDQIKSTQRTEITKIAGIAFVANALTAGTFGAAEWKRDPELLSKNKFTRQALKS